MSERRRILLAAGGTGGHMFPARALAEELMRRGHSIALVTDRRGGGLGQGVAGLETYRIRAGGLASGDALKRLKGLAALAVGTLQAARLVRRIGADAVVGFGGYTSVPPALAAAFSGVPVVIHEQNAVLGRANRALAGRALRIATSFDSVSGLSPRHHSKVQLTGNPVRYAIAALGERPYAAPAGDGRRNILVLGGSLGAGVFGRVVAEAVARLPEGLRRRLRISQQCLADDQVRVAVAYSRLGVAADLATFFDDVPERLKEAHLVIARAGASTVAELMAAGRPAILVPYPRATDDHQRANARALEAAGGSWMEPEPSLTPDKLAELLANLFERPEVLARAAAAAR
ncbi:MAG: undecaprenyldiphospho-muramoylpentapeptide beta-N-acetylglucosaminyltransferase, partial [Alphaproteobacteria bacterium]